MWVVRGEAPLPFVSFRSGTLVRPAQFSVSSSTCASIVRRASAYLVVFNNGGDLHLQRRLERFVPRLLDSHYRHSCEERSDLAHRYQGGGDLVNSTKHKDNSNVFEKRTGIFTFPTSQWTSTALPRRRQCDIDSTSDESVDVEKFKDTSGSHREAYIDRQPSTSHQSLVPRNAHPLRRGQGADSLDRLFRHASG